jgi:hypothetical protein
MLASPASRARKSNIHAPQTICQRPALEIKVFLSAARSILRVAS